MHYQICFPDLLRNLMPVAPMTLVSPYLKFHPYNTEGTTAYLDVHIHTHTCIYMYIYNHTHCHEYTHILTHTHTHIYIHSNIYTHTHTSTNILTITTSATTITITITTTRLFLVIFIYLSSRVQLSVVYRVLNICLKKEKVGVIHPRKQCWNCLRDNSFANHGP